MSAELRVGDRLESGQVTKLSCTEVSDPTNDCLDVGFGVAAAFDIRQGSARVQVRRSGGFLKLVEDLACRCESRHRNAGQFLGIRLASLIGQLNELDRLFQEHSDAAKVRIWSNLDGLASQLEGAVSNWSAQFLMVVLPR